MQYERYKVHNDKWQMHLQDEFLSINKCFQEYMAQYDLFFQNVMKGKLGPTAQYWSIYVYMINRVHRELMHAVCTNDIDAYITILLILIYIFFALNRSNYAHCGIYCYFKLTKAAPQIRRVLQLGAFSIRRTSKHFA